MITGIQARQVLCRITAVATLLLMGAPAALANPPGYPHRDVDQSFQAEALDPPVICRDEPKPEAGYLSSPCAGVFLDKAAESSAKTAR